MRTIVCKFGGSSTANAACCRRILAIIRASPARRCVVLSAPGTDACHDVKVTQLLCDCWRLRGNAERLWPLVEAVTERYSCIARALGLPDMREVARRTLRKALAERLPGKTQIIVAQRIATVMRADKIIVLDEGRIVGQGVHGDLLRTCRQYREIAYSQLSPEELERDIALEDDAIPARAESPALHTACTSETSVTNRDAHGEGGDRR